MVSKRILITFVLLLICSPGYTDEIIFVNGDRLIGTLKTMNGDKVTFISEIAGEITVASDKIKQISTILPVEISLKNGSKYITTKMRNTEKGIDFIDTAQKTSYQINSFDLLGINLPTKPSVVWSTSLTVGLTSSHGNTTNSNGNLSVDIERKSDKHRLNLTGFYIFSRKENPDADVDPDEKDEITSDENFTVTSKYDYFLTNKVYLFLSGSYKKDHIADLDYRIITTTGIGYQWIDVDTLKFNTDWGLSIMKKKYSTKIIDEAKDNDKNVQHIKKVDKKTDLALQFGCRLDWKPCELLSFSFNMAYNPIIDDFSDYFLTADSELRASINKRLFSSLKIILDYDSTPGESLVSAETKYIMGLGFYF